MSIGRTKSLNELCPGEWFLAVRNNGPQIGFIVKFEDGLKPILVTSESARGISSHGFYSVYVPDETEVQVDSLSLTDSPEHQYGHLVFASNGIFIPFSLHDWRAYANLHTGLVDDPAHDRLHFSRWSLLEKQFSGYVPLLEFGKSR